LIAYRPLGGETSKRGVVGTERGKKKELGGLRVLGVLLTQIYNSTNPITAGERCIWQMQKKNVDYVFGFTFEHVIDISAKGGLKHLDKPVK